MNIEVIEIEDIKVLLKGARCIGKGKTGKCFLLQDGSLFKIYRDTPNTAELFHQYDMLSHLNCLSQLNNEIYVGPIKIYTHKNQVIGYAMRYIPAKTLYKINKKVTLNEIREALNPLIDATFLISSEMKYTLVDMHGGNILYKEGFHVIDLDPGYFTENDDADKIMCFNMKKILCTIIDGIVGSGRYIGEEISFYNKRLDSVYEEVIYKNYQAIDEFFGNLKEEVKQNNPTIKDVQRLKRRLYYLKLPYYKNI